MGCYSRQDYTHSFRDEEVRICVGYTFGLGDKVVQLMWDTA